MGVYKEFMKFKFVIRGIFSETRHNFIDPHFKSAFEVYTLKGNSYLGVIFETDNDRGWVAGIKNRITGSMIFKRGYPSKQKAAERLYEEAVLNAI